MTRRPAPLLLPTAAAAALLLAGCRPAAPTGRPLTIGFVGDSITANVPPDGGRSVADEAASALGKRLGGRRVAAVNAAVAGSTSADWRPGKPHLNAALDAFKKRGVERVLVMLGTNDAIRDRRAPAAYAANVEALARALNTAGYKVILNVPPYCVPGAKGVSAEASALCRAYQDAVAGLNRGRDVVLGDDGQAYEYFRRHPDELHDGIHPNQRGARSLADIWARGAARVLKTTP
jgi:lysophospholipase L1-like esterase